MKSIPLSISPEKFQRFLKYSTSKKVIKTNHRGQKYRWNERKATKEGTKITKRFRGKPIVSFKEFEVKLEDFKCQAILSVFETSNYKNNCNFTFLCRGMCALIESTGEVGAISFNAHYYGCRIIYSN